MTTLPVYDLAGIGIGPFNLGLAALAAPISDLDCIFFDNRPQFSWHEGLLLPNAKMQVPFLADLVTGADPTSRFSFLAFLKQTNRLYQFAVLDDPYILRSEYLQYCRWVAEQITSLHYNHQVEAIRYDAGSEWYELSVLNGNTVKTIYARRLVIGVGSVPYIPEALQPVPDAFIHASQYLHQKTAILQQPIVTVIGSGQSAAEVFYDLMQQHQSGIRQLNWCTRSSRFHPMETAKLTQEMTSPDYIRYFHQLSAPIKAQILKGQQHLFKGIDADLIAAIYQALYRRTEDDIPCRLYPNFELQAIVPGREVHELQFFHKETAQTFSLPSHFNILATGYQPHIPSFLAGIRDRVCWDEQGRYEVNQHYGIDEKGTDIFVQNAEMHTHGFNTPDLGMGPYRNAVILNAILGYEHYKIEVGITYQCFDPLSQIA
jgi:lysine N6-hydroxylase